MVASIRNITISNKDEILALHVAKAQEGFIETTQECLEEAGENANFVPVGLYVDDIPVGFAMYGSFQDEKEGQRVWLDRFLIDSHYQGKGYGRLFLEQLIQHLIAKYQCKKIYLSVYDNNKHAIHLYQQYGFFFTGELDTKGEKVMVKDISN